MKDLLRGFPPNKGLILFVAISYIRLPQTYPPNRTGTGRGAIVICLRAGWSLLFTNDSPVFYLRAHTSLRVSLFSITMNVERRAFTSPLNNFFPATCFSSAILPLFFPLLMSTESVKLQLEKRTAFCVYYYILYGEAAQKK